MTIYSVTVDGIVSQLFTTVTEAERYREAWLNQEKFGRDIRVEDVEVFESADRPIQRLKSFEQISEVVDRVWGGADR